MCCMVFILNRANASERLFLGEQFLSAHHTSRYSLAGAGFSDRFADIQVCMSEAPDEKATFEYTDVLPWLQGFCLLTDVHRLEIVCQLVELGWC